MSTRFIPPRYQQKPTPPPQIEAVLLTTENLPAVAEWLNTLGAGRATFGRGANGHPFTGYVQTDQTGDHLRIPFWGGWTIFRPGDWLIRHQDGRITSCDDFAATYEPLPDTPGVCSCLSPRMSGHAEPDGPMVWDRDCKVCGRDISGRAAEVLAACEIKGPYRLADAP